MTADKNRDICWLLRGEKTTEKPRNKTEEHKHMPALFRANKAPTPNTSETRS